MGNQAGNIAACAAGGTAAVGAGAGIAAGTAGFGCAAASLVPPLGAACFAGLGAAAAAGGIIAGVGCAGAVNGQPPPPPDDDDPDEVPADAGDAPVPDSIPARRKRQYGRSGWGRGLASGRTITVDSFDAFDRDGDGWLTFVDMPSDVRNQAMNMVLTSILTYSHVMDANADGRISRTEWNYFKEMSGTDRGAMQMMFMSMDRNKDGRLGPDELVEETGTCTAMNGRPDSMRGYYDTMRLLDRQKKGYVVLGDMWGWYQEQSKPVGYQGIWKQPQAQEGGQHKYYRGNNYRPRTRTRVTTPRKTFIGTVKTFGPTSGRLGTVYG